VRKAGIAINHERFGWSLAGISALAIFYLLGIPGRRRKLKAALFFGLLCLIGIALGCGGGGGGSIGTGGGNGGGGGGTSNTPVATTTTLSTSSAKVPANQTFTLTATVTSSQPITGTVTFYGPGFAFPYPQGAPVVNGVATYSGPLPYPLNPGIYNFTANYSGDTNNYSSASTAINEVFTGTSTGIIWGQTGSVMHPTTVNINIQ
jgi:Bacterial Ig-like domain (group 3)